MRMSNHQLPLLQRCQLRLRRRAQHRVPRCRELVRIHPAEERGARVSHDPTMNLRAELLRTEQNQAEVPAALRDIEQHFSDVSVGPITRRVFVELVDEDDEVLDAEIPALQMLAELGYDASEDEVLRIFLEVGDVDYVHRAVRKAPKGEVAHVARVGHQSGAARRDIRETVANFADGRDVVRAPTLPVALLHSLQDIP